MELSNLRILLLEDDLGDALLVERSLANARLGNYEFEHVSCYEKALSCLERESFDVVLLDMSLPDCSGLELVTQMCEVCQGTPVIVLTGNSDEDLADAAIAQGAQDYLLKDELIPGTLRRVLRYAVQRQRALVQVRDANLELESANDLLGLKNERLAKLNAEAMYFIDQVSHEFRTPLTVVKEYSEIMRDGLAGPVNAQQCKFLNIVSDRAEDLANMVDDMLDVSKLQSGLLFVRRCETNFHDILKIVRPALEHKAKIKQVTLEFPPATELPNVYCDPEKIARIINNLTFNAIKFCGVNGCVRIWLKADVEQSELWIGVTDDGPGITKDNLKLIFNRFEQIDGATNNSTKGVGLGLSIAKELVGLNLGRMNVDSEPDQGSTFTFSIPFWAPNQIAVRYVKHCLARTDYSRNVKLVVVTIFGDVAPAKARFVDDFLQHSVRAEDAVIRTSPHKWLVLVNCHPSQSQEKMELLNAGWKKATKNLPNFDSVPSVEFLSEGEWDVQAQTHQFLKAVHRHSGVESDLIGVAEPMEDSSETTCIAADSVEPIECQGSILVVDDDWDLLQGLLVQLRSLGYRVLVASDGVQAIGSVLENRPDAVLMDNYMPKMNGVEALAELKRIDEVCEIPIIMHSASVRDREKALSDGAHDFLQKPCPQETIVAVLAAAIGQRNRVGVQ